MNTINMNTLHMNTIKKNLNMKKVFFFASLLFAGGAFAQDNNMFVVYSLKGNVSIVDSKTETKARIGTILDGDETIKVGAGSFATLICNETKSFSLRKAGSYSTSSLKDSCKISGGSVSSNYLKYVWSEMTKSKGTPEKNRKYFMSNVGAVSRGNINNVWVDPRLDSVNYVSGTIPLSWKSYTEAEEFEFRLYDESKSTPLVAKTVKKKHVDIAELLKVIQPGKVYYWSATVKGEPENDDKKYFHFVTRDEFTSFYNMIKQHNAAESDAEKNFRIGFVLEENHYIAEAFNHYLKATQLDPTNGLYRFTFMSFKKDFEIK
jgi:hypothetical protein